jgi:hypothetical protein
LVGVGGEAMDLVAQGQFDGAEDLVVGQVGQSLGHLGQGPLKEGPEAIAEVAGAGFAVLCGRVRGAILWTGHACSPALREKGPDALADLARSDPQAADFAPKIVKRYRHGFAPTFFLDSLARSR